jgi:transposase InsO family protein
VPLPVHAFQWVSADIFLHGGVNYLLVVDAYSKWPACVPLRSLSSSSVVAEMERIFSDFGVPEIVMSDNGSQFDCAEFREFCEGHTVRSVTSSPTYAQSNGLVERHIQTVKKTLLKMFTDGRSLWEALAAIRSTPISSELPSPAVLLQGRHLRDSLPFLQDRLVPQFVPAKFVHGQLQRRQATACFNHSGRLDVRGLALIIGQRVRAFVSGLWLPGAVEAVCSEPDSYVVRLADGRAFRSDAP